MIKGYTTGVFDLFHIGHLNLLKNAWMRCDKLIVGVSTDDLVVSYKGKRPIIPCDQRIAIIRALECVDNALLVTSRDKYMAWEYHKFDILFVGDDWKGKTVWIEWEKKLMKVGAKVIYLPYTKEQSTTKILDSII